MIHFFNLIFSILLFAGPVLAKENLATKNLSNKDYAVLFSTYKSIGTYAGLVKMATNSDANWSQFKSNFGLQENTELPKVSLEGNYIKFEGLNKKLDLTNLHKGEVYDGYTYFRFKSKTLSISEADKFILFMTNKTASYSVKNRLPALFFTSAQAAEPSKGAGGAIVAAGAYVGLMSLSGAAAILPLLGSGSAGGAAVAAGAAVVLAAASDTVIKLGIRKWRGNEIICEKGKLFLKTKSNKIILDSSESGAINKSMELFNHSDIGAAELATRRLLCKEPEKLRALNTKMEQMVDEKSHADQTRPSTDRQSGHGKTNN